MITLDLETLPTNDPAVIERISASIKPPGNMSRAETIAKWEAEEKPAVLDRAIRATALDGTYGRILCIGWAVDDEPAQAIIGNDEQQVIAGFFEALSRRSVNEGLAGLPSRAHPIVGHNIIGFDLRFLWQRCIVNRIKPSPVLPWDSRLIRERVADTMLLWNPDRDKRISLDALCRVLGIPSSKGDMDGSMIYDAWREGRLEDIEAYCRADVEATRQCYRRIEA